MKIFLLFFFWAILSTSGRAQEFSAARLISLVSQDMGKTESALVNRKFAYRGAETVGDTIFKTFESRSPGGGKKKLEPVERKCRLTSLKGKYALTYETTSLTEYNHLIAGLKAEGFACGYETDSSYINQGYVYQQGLLTSEVRQKIENGSPIYQVTVFKKNISPTNNLQTAEDLLEFNSHEYLVHFFGEKNVSKDMYFFAENDIANCSVLFINTARQVIFVWKDGLNRRKIANLLVGGQHNLKSQMTNDKTIAENTWKLKNGLRVGMPLLELRNLNDNNISFCGGKAPNPGLVLPESSGKIDFNNADVVLGCVNCTDDRFMAAQKLNSDRALDDGRILFVLSIVLYPVERGLYE